MKKCVVCNKNETDYTSVEFPTPICEECAKKLLEEYNKTHYIKWGYELLDLCVPIYKERK